MNAPTKPLTPRQLEAKLALEFRRGYYRATANLVSLHGGGTVAEDVLNNYGNVDFRGIDQQDADKLKPAAAELRRKRRAGV